MGNKFKEAIISKLTLGNNLLTYVLKGAYVFIQQQGDI